ncbi:hypothetical protein GDO86_001472 [Hymenochirus boettgeri]|uniref:gluconokinase n=1 Tax=Hymenochirus boettgeri TaxID=247094 RepID=A0A8T2KH86_9PIPI|nr:hypothetical protein GDO86_001472 [Hymenochirus boettgeri]
MFTLQLGWKFYDADDYHPLENKLKMSQGIPLNDQVPSPFIINKPNTENACGQQMILSCSALKRAYRTTLLTGNSNIPPENQDDSPETLLSTCMDLRKFF